MKYEQSFWDDRYSMKEFVYGKEPNDFFKEQLALLKPGKVLLPCDGEGRNGVYAATQHWKVDAFDQSEKGMEKAMALAKEFNVSINYFIADATVVDMGEDKYDAIALIYAHFPSGIRKKIHQKLARALKKGGVLILESFNPKQLNNTSGGPKDVNMLYTPEILADDFSDLSIELNSNFRIHLQESEFHHGIADVVRFIGKRT